MNGIFCGGSGLRDGLKDGRIVFARNGQRRISKEGSDGLTIDEAENAGKRLMEEMIIAGRMPAYRGDADGDVRDSSDTDRRQDACVPGRDIHRRQEACVPERQINLN